MKKAKVYAVIPAYNEGKRILPVIKNTLKQLKNVIVVDDGSTDHTADEIKKTKATLLKHVINLGKGAALKTGCDYALKQGAQVIIALDADAQHDPKDIPRFLAALKSNHIVFGCRTLNKHMPIVLRFGNWFISSVSKVLYGVAIPDTQSGYRCFTAVAYKKIRWKANDYSMETEMIANVGKRRLRYTTIRIKTAYPDRYKGTTVLDGVKIVFNMLWWKVMKRG